MSNTKKDENTVDPANVHITDTQDTATMSPAGNVHITDAKDTATMSPAGNVHITDAKADGTFSPDNVHITSEPA
ncbi:hypothetical protein ACF09H_34300 [Streptomyces sp. NPDC014983]|uniref:hypothetical protein n=1 Tax=Streptomyces sp. NPDC014983 TaxID=3364933 RepID=UPI0036FADB25